MIFDEFDLDAALGVLLAHSMRIEGRKLGKGKPLGKDDIALLANAGLRKVMGIRLEANDVGEDRAALQLAERLKGDNLECGPALTGRCNLIAVKAGLAVIDAQALSRVNHVDESVTVASIPPYEVIEPGQIVATIKIIPFAVPEPVLETCLAVASASIIRVLPFLPMRIGHILSRLPGLPESVIRQTREITQMRVKALGSQVTMIAEAPHDTGALSRELRKMSASNVDLILISGASATQDRRDVVPSALVHAGGVIDHFGMPVDPGNLLLLGRIGKQIVIDMPGCGRSARLNGLDLLLRRLLAGLPVTGADLMSMGSGGLLKDIGYRPMPRRPEKAFAASPRTPKVGAVILAAGKSVRMKGANKLLAMIGDQPMARHVAQTALAAKLASVVMVTGYQEDQVRACLSGLKLVLVSNPSFADGLASSLRAGLQALPSDIDAALILLADMPMVTPDQINRLIAAFDPDEGRAIIVPTIRGKRGNPVLWAKNFFGPIQAIEGDVGARHLIGENLNSVFEVEMEDDSVLTDIDKPEDLEAVAAYEKR
ncbi:MAG: molybdopterin-binding/glycosyltransferase family 2 protein [Alphaproteobacteria bacterium]|nr:molybdopterin-binding/glycosyltransferase family 2 protein [Alphaproteobacteria bacterium]